MKFELSKPLSPMSWESLKAGKQLDTLRKLSKKFPDGELVLYGEEASWLGIYDEEQWTLFRVDEKGEIEISIIENPPWDEGLW